MTESVRLQLPRIESLAIYAERDLMQGIKQPISISLYIYIQNCIFNFIVCILFY